MGDAFHLLHDLDELAAVPGQAHALAHGAVAFLDDGRQAQDPDDPVRILLLHGFVRVVAEHSGKGLREPEPVPRQGQASGHLVVAGLYGGEAVEHRDPGGFQGLEDVLVLVQVHAELVAVGLDADLSVLDAGEEPVVPANVGLDADGFERLPQPGRLHFEGAHPGVGVDQYQALHRLSRTVPCRWSPRARGRSCPCPRQSP